MKRFLFYALLGFGIGYTFDDSAFCDPCNSFPSWVAPLWLIVLCVVALGDWFRLRKQRDVGS